MIVKRVISGFMLMLLVTTGWQFKPQQQVMFPKFDKEGHRGCRGLMPENTIPAMLKAIDLGVTTLEMDAVITRDEQVILSHEPFFNHEITTKANGEFISENEEKRYNIFQMTYEETRQYDVGLKPHPRFPQQQKIAAHKPLLRDVIDSAEQYSHAAGKPLPFYNIETKTKPETDSIYHPGPERFVKLLMKVVNEKRVAERVIIQSFDFRTLKIVHRNYPSVRLAALVEADDKRSLEEQLTDLGFVPTIYSPDFSLVTRELVKSCHKKNIKVIPWTVDEKNKIDALKKMGVDGIITDYPNLFQ